MYIHQVKKCPHIAVPERLQLHHIQIFEKNSILSIT